MAKILKKKIETGAAIGPFDESPFGKDTFLSPLNSVPKKQSEERRLILDLSFPQGNSINDGTDKDIYLGRYEKLVLPSVDTLAEKIMALKKPKVFKIDLMRAYHQIFLDPGSINWVGYVFQEKFYFDTTLSMGSRSSARCCQAVTSAVVFIFTNWGFFAINYLDDLGGCEEEDKADLAFEKLREILHSFGLQEALSKSCSPAHIMTFLGIKVNCITKTLSIPEEKWTELIRTTKVWQNKKVANLKQTQQLAGLLNFACRCVKSGRIYLSRILNFLRSLPQEGFRPVPNSVKKDVKWWIDLAQLFNGVSMMTENTWTEPDVTLSSDSCLTGGGAFCKGRFIHWKYPSELLKLNLDINQLECMMVIVALKKWGKTLARKKLVLWCDNEVTVRAINSGCSRNVVIQNSLRELHKFLTVFHCELKVLYLKGTENRISDHLSRWHLHAGHEQMFRKITKNYKLIEENINKELWQFIVQEVL